MAFHMQVQGSLRAKCPHARRKWAHKLLHPSVHNQKVVDHLVSGEAVRFTDGAKGLSLEILQMFQKMRSVDVVDSLKAFDADAAYL